MTDNAGSEQGGVAGNAALCALKSRFREGTMADRIDVDVTGKSKFEVAEEMAYHILINMEKKSWETVKREEYLQLIADCIDALSGKKLKQTKVDSPGAG